MPLLLVEHHRKQTEIDCKMLLREIGEQLHIAIHGSLFLKNDIWHERGVDG